MNAKDIADDAQQSCDNMSNQYRATLERRIRFYGMRMFLKGLLEWIVPRRVKSKAKDGKHLYELECKEALTFVVHADDEEDAMMQVMMNSARNITQIDDVKRV